MKTLKTYQVSIIYVGLFNDEYIAFWLFSLFSQMYTPTTLPPAPSLMPPYASAHVH